MGIDFSHSELTELTPKITVIGVGGAGGNAVNNMVAASLQGVDFVVANTDAQALANSQANSRIQLGVEITQGLGAGAQPKVGEAAAEEAIKQIEETLDGVHMAFITAGMGGGTGTGAAPVIARVAREKGILTVGVVTKPFMFEGSRRMKMADAGIAALADHVDTLIIIPNQNLFCMATEKTTFADAFKMADEVLHSGVRGITDLMVMPGLINLDFADVRTVMSEMGKAMMGTGEAEGEGRAVEAAQAAIANPLLEDVSLNGARAVIINITGGMDMTLHEVDQAANLIRSQVDGDANIIVGSSFSQELDGMLRVSVVATGIEGASGTMPNFERQQIKTQIKTQVKEPIVEETPAVDQGVTDAKSEEEPLDLAPSMELGSEGNLTDADADEAEDIPTLSKNKDARPSSFVDPDAELIEGIDPQVQNIPEQQKVHDEIDDDGFDEDAIVAANSQNAFVAGAPKEPSLSINPMGHAEAFADAAYSNVAHEEVQAPSKTKEDVPRQSGGMSFFRKLTGGKKPDAEEVDVRSTQVGKRGAALAKSTGELEGQSKEPTTDQLEIPSFLRRQSN